MSSNGNTTRPSTALTTVDPTAAPLTATTAGTTMIEKRARRTMTVSVVLLGATLSAVLLAYLVFGDTNDQQALASVRQVYILFRHGDRTPTDTYPNDPHKEHEWPGGLGALTEKGALQTYSLGRHLHQRYFRLLPPNSIYTRDNMLVQSSAAERCLMSAAAMLAGLMPPLDGRHQLPLAWQPVPIASVPRAQDAYLAQKRPCPRYDDALRRLWANGTRELKRLNDESAELFAYLSKHSGLNITHIAHVESLYNTLDVQHTAGLALPAWTESVYPDRMRPLAERTLAAFTETPYMRRIRGGALLTVWLDTMLARRARTLRPERSVFVYAAHDVTMINMMRALGVLAQTAARPAYASALVLELHHSVVYNDDVEVQLVYYLSGDDKLPKRVALPGCRAPCSLTQLERSLEQLLVRDYDELCKML